MNGRERILAVINHTESNKVPGDLGATPLAIFEILDEGRS